MIRSQTGTFGTTSSLALRLFTLALAGVFLFAGPGCAAKQKPQYGKQSGRQQADPRAQQQYYDAGLQQYSQENYGEARDAFQKAVELGPNTDLGRKAQENLRKIQRILKTLEEIKTK